MLRVHDLPAAKHFFCDLLGLVLVKEKEYPQGEFTLVFLATQEDVAAYGEKDCPMIELTYNWDKEKYTGGRNFGHLAYAVKDIYFVCQKLKDNGVVIHRPPRDGRMAFVKSPDGISIELLQEGEPLPLAEPWVSAESIGSW